MLPGVASLLFFSGVAVCFSAVSSQAFIVTAYHGGGKKSRLKLLTTAEFFANIVSTKRRLKMLTYTVTVDYTGSIEYHISATNEEEAKLIAEDLFNMQAPSDGEEYWELTNIKMEGIRPDLSMLN
jgi:hypothetical protein